MAIRLDYKNKLWKCKNNIFLYYIWGYYIIADGKPFITLYQVRDPHGLTRIAKGAKIQTIQVEKMLKKGIKPKVKNDNSDLMWQNCRTLKNQDSNFVIVVELD